VTIVMGLDQHRAQITFDLLDTETGEVRGGRVRPADRESFRRFLRPFSGKRIEAALAATTGWRFLVEELRPVGALDGVLAGDRREHPQMRRGRLLPAGTDPEHRVDAAVGRDDERGPALAGLDVGPEDVPNAGSGWAVAER
jgi:hypothetical protein